MLRKVSTTLLKLFGWKTDNHVPELDKYVLIGAPHTTNWDFPLTLLALSSLGIRFNWVAKHTLFRWPLGPIFTAIGGVPVDRSSGTAFLKRIIDLYGERDHFILAIAPEGTRSKTSHWKTGFYALARKAGVPVALGYIDYHQKRIGIGQVMEISGDMEADFAIIRDFYSDKIGKYPAKQSDIIPQGGARKRKTGSRNTPG